MKMNFLKLNYSLFNCCPFSWTTSCSKRKLHNLFHLTSPSYILIIPICQHYYQRNPNFNIAIQIRLYLGYLPRKKWSASEIWYYNTHEYPLLIYPLSLPKLSISAAAWRHQTDQPTNQPEHIKFPTQPKKIRLPPMLLKWYHVEFPRNPRHTLK